MMEQRLWGDDGTEAGKDDGTDAKDMVDMRPRR